jgi:hypothetical protein
MANNNTKERSTGHTYSKRSEPVIVQDIIEHIGR